ncbi:MAG: glycosyltransferase [Cytophagales bacterium]
MKKQKLIFIHTGKNTFVQSDLLTISERYDIYEFEFNLSKSLYPMILEQFRLLFWFFKNCFGVSKLFVWFCDYHTFLPVLFFSIKRSTSYIVLGGVDSTYIPEINYGVLNKRNKIRFFMASLSLKLSSYILPVDKSLINASNHYPNPNKPFKTGVMNFVNLTNDKFRVIPTSYDSDFWKSENKIDRENSVILVASVNSLKRFLVKGVDFALEIAEKLYDTTFYIIGVDEFHIPKQYLVRHHSVKFIKKLNKNDLLSYYQKSKIILVPSLSEGLPNALCEGMLCGCVPVVTDIASLREIVEDCGFIIEKRDVNLAKEMILKAFDNFEDLTDKSRTKIKTKFKKERRKEEIFQLFDEKK